MEVQELTVTVTKAMIHCQLCGWGPDPGQTTGGQYRQLKEHWRDKEFNRFRWYQWGADEEELMFQKQTGTSIICQLWRDLDEVTDTALDMVAEDAAWEEEAVARFGSGIWDSTAMTDLSVQYDRLLRELQRKEKTKVGRGLAIALTYMSKPYFETADDVVRHAVERSRARARGESVFTPGTGSGFEADQAWLDRRRKGLPEPAPVAAEPVQTGPKTPEVAPAVKDEPQQDDPCVRVALARAQILEALDAGFAPELLAGTYGVDAATLLQVVGR